MILIDRKGLSPELLLISDGEFFEAPSILMIFPNSDADIRGDLACAGDPAVFVHVCNEAQYFLRCGLNEAHT